MKESFIIDLDQLRALRALRDRGTITAAARALHLSPSAVSQQIAALARSVNAPLLEKHGRGVRLTPQAQILLQHADNIYEELERTRADLAEFDDGHVGTVTVCAFASAIEALVVPAMARLARERPRLRFSVDEAEAPDCFDRLDAGTCDVAVTMDYPSGPVRGDPRYYSRDLCVDPLYAAVPMDHPLSERRAIAITELANDNWIGGTRGQPCFDIVIATCIAAGITPRFAHTVSDWRAILALVASGAGVSLIPSFVFRQGHVGVAALPIRPQHPSRRIYAAVPSGSEDRADITAVLCALTSSNDNRNRPPTAGPEPARLSRAI